MRYLSDLSMGDHGIVRTIGGEIHLVERLYELGFLRGRKIVLVSKTIFNDPLIVEIGDSVIALRKSEARCVELE